MNTKMTPLVALATLWNFTVKHPTTSTSAAMVAMMLSLYNGNRFKFDLTEFRRFDAHNREAAMTVLEADARGGLGEVHDWLNRATGRSDFGHRFEILAYQYGLKGRVTKARLPKLSGPNPILRLPGTPADE